MTKIELNKLPCCTHLSISETDEGRLIQAGCHFSAYSSPCIPIACPKGAVNRYHIFSKHYSHKCDLEVIEECIKCNKGVGK